MMMIAITTTTIFISVVSLSLLVIYVCAIMHVPVFPSELFCYRVADIDDCTPNPCNQTTTLRCEDEIAAYNCVCKDGYDGDLCSNSM